MTGTPDDDAGFAEALRLARGLHLAIGPLEAERSATLQRLRSTLTGGGGAREALYLLRVLHPDFTVALADLLARRALVQRDTMLVRQLFARLPRDEAVGVVPTAVWRQLAETPDDEAYRRMAELLDYLGLDDALRELADAARASDAPGMREVADDFWPA